MCYYLYGKINKAAFEEAKHISADWGLMQGASIDDKETPFIVTQMFNNPKLTSPFFRITKDECDCVTCIGNPQADIDELKRYENWLHSLKSCKQIKFLYLLKYWDDGQIKKVDSSENIHIDDLDSLFLYKFQPNVIYKVLYYVRNMG